MKTLLITFLLLFSILSSAQINGKVLNENNDPVEFATLFNINKETSAITNADGIFQLEGELGNSIRIQHLNYEDSEAIVSKLKDNYTLIRKNYDLGEVVVSANYAARLFEKSCENTYNKLKDKNVTRGFLRKLRIENKDTVRVIDLDLDVVQRKQKRYNLEDRILPSKVQSRIVTDTSRISKLRMEIVVFQSFNEIDWSKFQRYFNYFKVEDSQFVKLYFFNKESFKDSITHIEVKILKTDSCLSSVSLVTQNPLRNRKGDILKMKSTSFIHISYDYESGFVCLNETSQGLIMTGSENGRKDVSIFQFYKTYNNGATKLKSRSGGTRIFHNALNVTLIKNKYDEEFWEKDSFPAIMLYDYTYLLNLKIGEN